MRIGDLAKRTGVSQRSLRHYEAKGLLSPQRDSSGYRVYGPDAVERVLFIRDLLGSGFSAREAAAFLPCLEGGAAHEPCPEGVTRHEEKLRQIEAAINTLEARRKNLLERLEVLRLSHQESVPEGDQSNHVVAHPLAGRRPVSRRL